MCITKHNFSRKKNCQYISFSMYKLAPTLYALQLIQVLKNIIYKTS